MKKAIHTSSLVVTFILLFFGLVSSAQTFEQAQKITSSYNKTYLRELASQSLQKSRAEKKEAVAYARARNIPISYTTKEGSYVELQYMLKDGTLIYYQTHNADASAATRANHLNSEGATNLNLDGQDMTAYVWDAGHARVTHQEFDNRVSINDVLTIRDPDHNHATHVAGTIAASGVAPAAKGMAPWSKVKAYEWTDDLGEATLAALDGMLLSNHSYGYGITDPSHNYLGAYNQRSRDWDNLLYNAPYYLMVNSAGNDGENFERNNDKLSGFGTSKNNLVVAAAQDAIIDDDGNLTSVAIWNQSSQGPTDDLRIKPDITGNGVGVYSSYASSDTDYRSVNGTSMAAPNITGTLLLLQQHYNDVNETFMRAATLKGLALHTADDVGAVGPDAISGWGLLNAKKAAETISNNGSGSLIQELIISQGQTITITVEADSSNDLMASISWTDYPGLINNDDNSTTPALMNDLDIRVENEDTIYFPWKLTSPSENAMDGDNTKDPFERVDVENASGTYTITITLKDTSFSASQAFSLVVTGIEPIQCGVAVPINIEVHDIDKTSAFVTWDMILMTNYDLRYREIGTTPWIEISDVPTNYYQLTGLNPNTVYEVAVRSRCSEGNPSGYSEAVNFITLEYCVSASEEEDESVPFYISNVKLNTIDNTSEQTHYSDFTDQSTDLVEGQTYTISITNAAQVGYQASYSVWIDFNNDGDFDDLEERVFTKITFANILATGSFTVPLGINPSSTRMRVSMIFGVEPPEPCDFFRYGEVEDYTINLRLPTDFIYDNATWTPFDPAGASTSMDNIQVLNGSTVFTTDITAKNIYIAPGASLYVEKVLTLAGNLTINGELVFVSNAAGNGELAAVPETSIITGNVTVQRYMSDHRSYRMVTSAVDTDTSIHANWQEGASSNTDNPAPGFGTHITGSTTDQQNGFDGTATGAPSMYYLPNGTQAFAAIDNTDVNNLVAGKAYLMFVRGDRSIDLTDNEAHSATTLRATGELYFGSYETSYTAEAGYFLMFGNPYQSAVDITSVLTNSTDVNTNQYYLYDPTHADHGSYITVDLTEPTPTQYLQPGQAAQVEATGNNVQIIFAETDKAPGNFTATHRSTGFGTDKLVVQLFTTENFNNEGPLHDSFIIRFDESHDNGITFSDAVKPMNFYENLGINNNGTYLSIERRAMPEEGEVYSLFSSGYQHADYTLKLTLDGLDASFLYLDDYFMGSSTLLESGDTTYNFTVDKTNPLSIATDRFAIRTEARLDVDDHHMLAGIRLYPNPLDDNTFYINAPNLNGETVFISINDMLGREVFNTEQIFSGTTLKVELSQGLSSGVYTVNLSSKGAERSLRIIKK